MNVLWQRLGITGHDREKNACELEKACVDTAVTEKGDIKKCTSCRSLKMLEYAMKLVERAIDDRIQKTVKMSRFKTVSCKGKIQWMLYLR